MQVQAGWVAKNHSGSVWLLDLPVYDLGNMIQTEQIAKSKLITHRNVHVCELSGIR